VAAPGGGAAGAVELHAVTLTINESVGSEQHIILKTSTTTLNSS